MIDPMGTTTTEEATMENTIDNPACRRDTKYGLAICGFCTTARSVAAGMRFIVKDRVLPVDEAIAYNLARCPGQPHVEERVVVDEIRRDGQRILKAGTNVYVQLKRKPGTRRSDGYVVECYEDGTVRVHLLEIATTRDQATVVDKKKTFHYFC